MSSLRTTCRNAIAFLGLMAVLMGALEHESLAFQVDVSADGVVASATLLADGDSVVEGSHLVAFPRESGTEGTFRSENHFLSTAPSGAWRRNSGIRLASAHTGKSGSLWHRGHHACSRRVGVLALRL